MRVLDSVCRRCLGLIGVRPHLPGALLTRCVPWVERIWTISGFSIFPLPHSVSRNLLLLSLRPIKGLRRGLQLDDPLECFLKTRITGVAAQRAFDEAESVGEPRGFAGSHGFGLDFCGVRGNRSDRALGDGECDLLAILDLVSGRWASTENVSPDLPCRNT